MRTVNDFTGKSFTEVTQSIGSKIVHAGQVNPAGTAQPMSLVPQVGGELSRERHPAPDAV